LVDLVKKLAIAIVALAVLALGVYRIGGRQFSRDGSGVWPRFFSSMPDYEALEADRARQRKAYAPVAVRVEAGAPTSSSSAPEASTPGGAAATTGAKVPEGKASPSDAHGETSGGQARADGSWPDFRGPDRDGRYQGGRIRTAWPRQGLPQLWKQPIGLGYASFVVADGRAFTIEQRRRQEVVSAYDVETGRELWTHGWDGEFIESMGGDGPRATPTYHDGRIYALGALGEFRCLDARTGALVWRRDILADNGATNLIWGMAGAPLVVDDTVIVLPGGPRGKSVAAYDRQTGAPVWTALDDPQAYVSPMLVTLRGVRQILVVSASRAMGLAVENGRLLWEYPWSNYNGITVAQPLLLGDDRVFLSAGYGRGAAAFEVIREGEAFSTRTLWQNTRMKNKFTSSVLHQGYIYGLDEAILACLDATTGELKWKAGRYGYGQVMLAGDHLIVLAEDGDVALVKATPEKHEELARFTAISGKTWNHPVIAEGRLIVRNLREMAAFEIRP
jgi:outer membrane protein assembly factor BamB